VVLEGIEGRRAVLVRELDVGRAGSQLQTHRRIAAAGMPVHHGVGEQLLDDEREAQSVRRGQPAVGTERLDERDGLGQVRHAGRERERVRGRHRRPRAGLSSILLGASKELGREIMSTSLGRRLRAGLLIVLGTGISVAAAADVGQIKIATGEVSVERKGQTMPGRVGLLLESDDVLKTGADGSMGITMRDNSLLSAGPNSILALERFEFDPTTSQGRFDAQLRRGTLAVVSGRIAKKTPQAMTVRTPSAVLGVRGTEFVVSVDE